MAEPDESAMRPPRLNTPSVIEDLAFCIPFDNLSLACVLLKIGEPIERAMMMRAEETRRANKRWS